MQHLMMSRDAMLQAFNARSEQQHAAILSSLGSGVEVIGPRLGANGQLITASLDPSQVHVNTPLPNVSIMYHNREMIADDVLPVVRVKKLSDVFFKYDPSMGFYLMKTDVADDLGRPGEASPALTTQTYNAMRHAVRDYIPQATLDNADAPIQPLIDSVVNLNAILRLARENRVQGVVFNAANFGTNNTTLTGGQQWSAATGTPITNIQTWITLCTMYPTVAAIGEQGFVPFINNPETKSFFTSRAGTTMGATPFFMDSETIAKALFLKKFCIGRAKYNSAPDGEAASIQSNWIWGKNFALLHLPDSLGTRMAAFGATFRFTGPVNIGGEIQSGEFLTRSWFEQWKGWAGAHVAQVSHADAELNIDGTGATGYFAAAVSQ